MKRLTTKIFTIAACAAMMLTAAPVANMQSVQAATKAQGTVNLATQKLVITKGSKTAMTNNTLQMVKGRRYQVKAKFGSTTVSTKGTYKSSKTNIVTVSSTGLVTAKAPGTATIKVTYNGKSQSFKVKVIASHTHSWKTLSKATCVDKGRKLCKICGATGSTAVSKTHNFEVTKKATCARKGVETCSDCGITNTLPKTTHHYVTKTSTAIEKRGKKTVHATSMLCPGCHWDMTDWTTGQKQAHQSHIDAMVAGIISEDCFSAGYTGVAGAERYEKYVKVKSTETFCENCGAWDMAKTYDEDLYYVDAKGNKISANEDPWYVYSYENYLKEHGFMVCPNCHDMEVMPGHTCQVCKTVAPTLTAKKAAAKPAVAQPQDTISVPDTVIDDATVDTDIVISENETVTDSVITDSELNTEITDSNMSGDLVFEDPDNTDDETDEFEDDGVLVIEDDDEGEVIEDE